MKTISTMRPSGFTIVELLVAVVVIAILAAVTNCVVLLYPALGSPGFSCPSRDRLAEADCTVGIFEND